MSGFLYVISGPSGSGKTSLSKALLEQHDHLNLSVSYTTRPKRPSEVEGKDYCFVQASDFESMVKQGLFAEYAQVFDHAYGTLKSSIDLSLQADQDLILEIDWQGAKAIKMAYPQAVMAFVFPPSLDQLRARLLKRKEDDPKVIQARLDKACSEMRNYELFDYLIINDDFDHALMEIKSIICSKRLTVTWQQTHRLAWIDSLLQKR